MRLILALALLGAVSASFRREDVARFREKNEEKIKQAIIDMENNNSSSSESGERSDLAGTKRDPDDSIQKAARAHVKAQREAAQKQLAINLEEELKIGLLGDKDHNVSPFDYLMFTMIYPTATCMADDDQVPDSCEIPAGTSQWTIHGLWPNFKDGSYPQFCDHQKYDHKAVEQLHEQMRTKWPNLFPKTPEDQLWSHEWEKHGTCSKTDPLLDSQFKYFNMTLFLLDHIDIRTRMEQKGISPRAAPYERDTLQKSLDELMGHHVQMYCLQDKKTHESLLADVRVCVDAQLKPIDCPQTEIRPYVRAGTVTPNDHQPLPVPRKCAESVYYVTAGADISKTIDLIPAGKDTEETTGKKLDTEKDYYDDDDDDDSEDQATKRDKEESEKTSKIEDELMKGLIIKQEEYEKNWRKVLAKQQGEELKLSISDDDIKTARTYARVSEMAKLFQEKRARGELSSLQFVDTVQPAATAAVPMQIYVGIGFLVVYLILIVAFFLGRSSGRQQYGRLERA